MTICLPLHQRASAPPATAQGRRMLVTVTVVGSAGPIRFVTSEAEKVAAVIGTTLRLYNRERRLPALGSDVGEFHLYCTTRSESTPLDASESIGVCGGRSFLLCKKTPQQRNLTAPKMGEAGAADARRQTQRTDGDGNAMGRRIRKTWFNGFLRLSRHQHRRTHLSQFPPAPTVHF